jgi:hypothetical protein
LRTGFYSFLGLALSSARAVWALEPSEILLIQKGPFALKPQFEVTETYDDNITYREEGKEADFKTVVSPGLTLQVGDKTFNYIDFTYFYDRVQYAETSELNANQHRAALVSRFEKRRFLLEGRDEFKSLASPLGGGISIGGIQVRRDSFDDLYRLNYDLSDKTGLYIEALHSTSDYESGIRLYDSFTLIGTVGFEYKALSKTSFFGEIYYGMTENDENAVGMLAYPTAEFVGGFVGARGNFTEKLTGTVKAGYEYRWYRGDPRDVQAPVVEVSLMERFTENTALNLNYSRRQRESAQFVRSTYVSDVVSASLLQSIGADGRLRAALDATFLSAAYENNPAYLVGERNDHILATGLTITYDIKLWLRAFGSYNFEYLDSNEPSVVDYRVNRVTMGLQLGY